MRTLRDLDEKIGRAERRLAARREHLNASLASSRARTRVSLASPKVIAAAFVAGFVLDRLGRMRPRSGESQHRGSAVSGIVAGLAAAALRAALSNPRVWDSIRNAWARRGAAQARDTSELYPLPAVRAASHGELEEIDKTYPATGPAGGTAGRSGAPAYGPSPLQR